MNIKKIIIYSRHGLRYPLFNKEKMSEYISEEKLNWDFEEGVLTPKGEIFEYKFGKFLKKYMDDLGYLVKNPIFFANSMKRTVLTAKILSLSMFPFDNVDVKYEYADLKTLDHRFNILLDDDKLLDFEALKKDNERLRNVYYKLEDILHLKRGDIFDLGTDIYIGYDNFLNYEGAYKIATEIIDMFILKYYENFNEKDIFESENIKKDIEILSKIKDGFLDSLFSNINYIKNSKLNAYKLLLEYVNNENDFAIIVGHDSNIATILSVLGIEAKGNEFEKYPIDAKLVFKIYEDDSFDLDMMYYDVETIRNNLEKDPIIEILAKNMRFVDER